MEKTRYGTVKPSENRDADLYDGARADAARPAQLGMQARCLHHQGPSNRTALDPHFDRKIHVIETLVRAERTIGTPEEGVIPENDVSKLIPVVL